MIEYIAGRRQELSMSKSFLFCFIKSNENRMDCILRLCFIKSNALDFVMDSADVKRQKVLILFYKSERIRFCD